MSRIIFGIIFVPNQETFALGMKLYLRKVLTFSEGVLLWMPYEHHHRYRHRQHHHTRLPARRESHGHPSLEKVGRTLDL